MEDQYGTNEEGMYGIVRQISKLRKSVACNLEIFQERDFATPPRQESIWKISGVGSCIQTDSMKWRKLRQKIGCRRQLPNQAFCVVGFRRVQGGLRPGVIDPDMRRVDD